MALGFSSFEGIGDVLLAEFFEMCKGLEVAIEQGHTRVCLESDSVSALEAVAHRSPIDGPFYDSVLSHINALKRKLVEVSFQHIPRQLNYPVD
ncbi:Ribonuclease H-like superfamily [Sesbania bispinosa]|nr:Ribonuclease H-like superfamily [Sesbania bispinosa]